MILIASQIASASDNNYELKIINFSIAQSALIAGGGGANLIQDGILNKPDQIDYNRPYCFSSGFHLLLNESENYSVIKISSAQQPSGVWIIALKMETKSSDNTASFRIGCITKNEPTMNDVQEGLDKVYQVIPLP